MGLDGGGAGPLAAATANREVAVALAGLTRAQRMAVLMLHLEVLARESGDPAVFLALLHEAMRERMGLEVRR
jgi:hypothetical protein